MYLISIYFDKTTQKRICGYMKQIGKVTGNTLMLDGNVPPHITIAAFHTESYTDLEEIDLKDNGYGNLERSIGNEFAKKKIKSHKDNSFAESCYIDWHYSKYSLS